MNGLGRTMAFILAVVAPLTARVSDTVAELWADFDAHTPLNTAVVRQWEEGGAHYQLVIYGVGTVQGSRETYYPRIAAYCC